MPKDGDRDHPIAREIRAARAYAGMSRKQLGLALGVSDQVIGALERGESLDRLEIRRSQLVAIAEICRLPERFELVTTRPATPSVAERARLAAQRLDGTPSSSPGTDDVQGAEGEAS